MVGFTELARLLDEILLVSTGHTVRNISDPRNGCCYSSDHCGLWQILIYIIDPYKLATTSFINNIQFRKCNYLFEKASKNGAPYYTPGNHLRGLLPSCSLDMVGRWIWGLICLHSLLFWCLQCLSLVRSSWRWLYQSRREATMRIITWIYWLARRALRGCRKRQSQHKDWIWIWCNKRPKTPRIQPSFYFWYTHWCEEFHLYRKILHCWKRHEQPPSPKLGRISFPSNIFFP